ncbi:TPA: lipid II:glycine glycyltransferase FemX [Streptococcus pyogenes]|uniref:aminoacyltransferase n=1 Tax=Streptococcus pyogenes TaxID=1314 RepID=UPI00050BDEA6|nr:lipid II:glycine glycyltransferase FemX [Streptococcus pyogenes]KGE56706.1 femAB family protein [Streptococcus pyogenes AA216]HER4552946.1 lipid II:glycine glycyltransferase FemX [Streptococcus pyogenes NGAS664]AWS22900.1 N-acetyltransferase [Streptococcus pyogenes]QCK26659.1 N-acetyltransferase [Streptococcus pyogenes]SQF21051.1 UDP-N-acetylmuramoylpentapeptide-lysine N(6)-alanyltransferase [Streptococcus pyogenes]
MYTYKVGISPEEHDQFVLAQPQAGLLQSSKWGKVKDNWKHERISFYENGVQVAAAACLIRKLPLGFTMIYIPRGPIMDYANFELLDFVIKTLKTFGKSKRALFVKIDPSLVIKQTLEGKESKENDVTLSIIAFLKKLGVEWSGRTKELEDTIQPRIQANIYAKDFDFDSLPKKAKQSIRTATNKGVNVTIGGSELLDDFSALMKKTENRKGIILRGKSYYQKLLDIYAGQSYITMASLDLPEQKKLLIQQLDKALAEQARLTDKSKPSKVAENQKTIARLQKDLTILSEQLAAGKTRIPLAATLTLIYGETSENLYAGMDDDYRNYQAPLLTWYETAKEAFKRGCRWHNLGGVENQQDGGLYHFKARLNPTIEEFAGEFNIPVGLVSSLAILTYNLRKKLRSTTNGTN